MIRQRSSELADLLTRPRTPAVVQEALRAKDVSYEKVIAAHGSPIPFLRRGSRDDLREVVLEALVVGAGIGALAGGRRNRRWRTW